MSYFGGKAGAGTAQAIINQQPPHETYIEAFAGHAAVLLAKRPAATNIAVEIETQANTWLRVNCPASTSVIHGDALQHLQKQRFDAHTLIYCDPPYLLRTRRAPRTRYRFEFTEADHLRLLNILKALPCMVQISGYADPLYSSQLQDWRCVSFQSMTRRGPATEYLWMNYPAPAALHTYAHLGANYRERERIRRKTARWTARLAAMPALERLALYSALSETLNKSSHADLAPPKTTNAPDR